MDDVRSPACRPRAAASWLALWTAIAWIAGCGQSDPTFTPSGGSADLGRIIVTSSVTGAQISLDGNLTTSVTPDTLVDVAAGDHLISVFLPGYEAAETMITVEADTDVPVDFLLALIPEPGSIEVALTAPLAVPATIVVDGVPTGQAAPGVVGGIQAGEHRVTVAAPGFATDPVEQLVTVLADQTVRAELTLWVERLVLCEDFSNSDCLPCPAADAALHRALEAASRAGVAINPHGWWPGAADPMFQFNTDAHRGRVFYAGVQQLPSIFVDGDLVSAGTVTEADIADALAARPESAPIAIAVEGALGGSSYDVGVELWAVEASFPQALRLFTCIVETEVELDPPGSNGQVHYTNVLRHIMPAPTPNSGEPGGQPVTLTVGESRRFDLTYDLPAGGLDPNHLAVIAFLQDDDSKVVVQVATNIEHD